MRPVEGALAADSLIQAPRRTSATVAALMVSVALVVGTAGAASSSFGALRGWMDTNLNPDFFVSPSETIAGRNFRFPESLGPQIERIPGVGEVQPVRTARIQFRGHPIMLVGAELEKVRRRAPLMVVKGDANNMYRLAAEEKGIIISESLAILQNIGLGETVELNTPSGFLRLPVVGVIRDYSNQLGSMYLDWGVYTRNYQDNTVDAFRLYLAPGASADRVKAGILDELGRGRRLFVLSNREVRDYVAAVTDQWFGMTYLQVLVAALVAVFGIVNTLTVSISDRRRELAVLRAVGGLRSQIRGTIWIEAAAIGLIGLALGVGIGAVQLYYELEAINDLAGFPLPYTFPVMLALALLPVIIGTAFAAAILPGEAAVRGSLVDALGYE
jgi:putative ABC transport system permease protein